MKVLRKLVALTIAVNMIAASMAAVFAETPDSESGIDEKVITEEGKSSYEKDAEDTSLNEDESVASEKEQESFEENEEDRNVQEQLPGAIDVNKNGWRYESGHWFYYSRGVKASSWLEYNGEFYYMDKDDPSYPGAMVSDSKKVISNATYFFDENGVMRTGWYYEDGDWYYLNSSGDVATGWKNIGGYWYYMEPENGEHKGKMLSSTWRNIDGHRYYFTSSGEMMTGWYYEDGDWYYLNSSGDVATGWKNVGGYWYYMEPGNGEHKGKMLSSTWRNIDGYRYYFTSSGEMMTGWYYEDGDWYYLNPSGDMATGWKKVGDYWYYMYSDGKMAVNTVVDGYNIGMSGAWYPYDDYIVVNIGYQTLVYYKNNKKVFSSDVVTGIYDSTPRGTFTIGYKASGIYLSGTGYRAYVSYWMPFIRQEYGLHDASWRSQFGGTIYKDNGSHGCINLPVSTAAYLFNNVISNYTKLIVE